MFRHPAPRTFSLGKIDYGLEPVTQKSEKNLRKSLDTRGAFPIIFVKSGSRLLTLRSGDEWRPERHEDFGEAEQL
jgi:hypothetical protein